MTRKSINLTTKLAAALLRIKNDDGGYLIPEPHRSSGTAESILGCVQWDHGVLHALGGPDSPQNLWPMLTADHREKSRSDTTKAAKSKRISREHEAFRSRLLSKHNGYGEEIIKERGKKGGIKSRGFDKTLTKKFNGEVVRRGEG